MERIWYQDVNGFFSIGQLGKFWPSTEMTFAQQLNASLRFSIYFSLVVLLVKGGPDRWNILFVPIFMALFTMAAYHVHEKRKRDEKAVLDRMGLKKEGYGDAERVCVKPSENNPFMNVLVSDYAQNPERPAACRLVGDARADAKAFFDQNLYRDVDDVFHKKASDRQFYTMPATTIPNDMNGYAKWLYGKGPTCKEGNGSQCVAHLYNDVRG